MMHRYSIDNDYYVTILATITLFSAILNAIINIIIIPTIITNNLLIQLACFIISFFISFEAILLLFDRCLWKLSFINKIIKCPNISGNWEGIINNPDYPQIPAEVEIKQTWTKIIINLKTETAITKTKALTFFAEDSDNPELCYIYYNESTTTKLKSHGGTGRLTFHKDKNSLEGDYYTDKHRKNHGTVVLNRK